MSGEHFINFALLLAFMLDIFLAIFIISRSSRKESETVFAISTMCVGFWTLGVLMFRVSNNQAAVIFWNREFIFASGLIASTFFHFSLALTFVRLNNLKRILIHLPNVLILVAVFVPNMLIGGVVYRSWGKESLLGAFYPLFALYFSAYVIFALYRIFRSLRKSSGLFRMQLRYIFWATLLTSIVGTYFNLYLILLGNYRYIWVGPYNSLILVSVIAYAITKTSLMDIRVVIGRTLAHVIAIIFMAFGYVAMAATYLAFTGNRADFNFMVITIFYGALVAESFQMLRMHIQTPVDRFFVKSRYDFPAVTRELAVRFRRSLTTPDVAKNIYPILNDTVDIPVARFFFKSKDSDDLVEFDPETLEFLKDRVIRGDDQLAAALKRGREFVYLPEKNDLGPKAHLAIPVLGDHDLLALIILSKKRSEDEFTEQDLDLFKTISEYVAIALEYIIKPYEEVKEKFEATERRLMDAEKELERAQRLASLGTVVAGVAHEIRNPMGIIQLAVERMSPEKIKDEKVLLKCREEVSQSIHRIDKIVHNMLALTRREEKKRVVANLNEIIDSTLRFFPMEGVRLVKELGAVPAVTCCPEEMQQVFINLIDNAVRAMPRGGELKLRTYQVGEKVAAEVSDTGKGIAKEALSKIFDPFFSTAHERPGLGLSIVYRIVREHNGEIDVKSQPGKGTTFILKLPLKG